MLFSESWLRTYVNPAISSREELQDALRSLEVDEARKGNPRFHGCLALLNRLNAAIAKFRPACLPGERQH